MGSSLLVTLEEKNESIYLKPLYWTIQIKCPQPRATVKQNKQNPSHVKNADGVLKVV